VADPFGAALCLILVGVFFAAPLYRMKLLTIGDFYKRRYGRSVEVLTTLAIVLSYLGWVGAQLTALGLVFNVVSDGAISMTAGMWIGAGSILIYTLFGYYRSGTDDSDSAWAFIYRRRSVGYGRWCVRGREPCSSCGQTGVLARS
jgi:Na+/proline symporter